MALAPGSVKRAVDVTGDDFRTFDDGGVLAQGAALVGDNGEHIGIDSDPLIAAPRTLSKSSTGGALEASHNALNIPGTFYRANVRVASGGGELFLMLFDLAAPPGGGATPVARASRVVFDGTDVVSASIEIPEGLAMANGIQVGISTTLATYTAAGAIGAFDVFFL